MNNLTVFGSIMYCRSRLKGSHYSPKYLGGNGTLASLAASKYLPVNLISIIGTDLETKYLEKTLGANINLKHVTVLEGPTFDYQATYDPKTFELVDEEINFGVYNQYNPEIKVTKAKEIENILFSGSNPKFSLAIYKNLTKTKLVGVNTLLYHLKNNYKTSIQLIKKATHLFTNQKEYKYLTEKLGEKNLFKSFPKLKFIFITQGKKGILVQTPKTKVSFALENNVTTKNPTNAGDVFTGTIIGLAASGLNLDKDLVTAIKLAQIEAGKVITNDPFYRKRASK